MQSMLPRGRICRVDDFTNGWREGKEWDDFLPSAPPAWGDRGVFFAPFGFELGQSLLGLAVVRGQVNPAQIFSDILAILPATEVQRVAHQVDDAGLHRGVGEGCVDGDQDIFDV